MDRLTRKDLKTDKFALEVEHTVEYVSTHRRQAVLYGGIAVAVILGVAIFTWARRNQYGKRQTALTAALQVQNAPVGQTGNEFLPGYPTAREREKAAVKAFNDVAANYSGSDEAVVARYYVGTIAADGGNISEAEKAFREVASSGNKNYASLAKLSLADIYKAQGKLGEGEKQLRSLIQDPTVFVSKEHATIALAELLMEKRPDEARKLLEPLRTQRSAISRTALTLLSQMPQK